MSFSWDEATKRASCWGHRLRQHRYVAFAGFLWRRFLSFRLTRVAASLSYTTLLALVPLLTVALIVVRAFPMFADLDLRFNRFVAQFLLPVGVSEVQDYIRAFSEKAGHLTVIGLLMLAVTAVMMMMTIEQAFNSIWRVNKQRPLLFRLLMYWTVLTLGPVGIGLLSSWQTFILSPSDLRAMHPYAATLLFAAASVAFYAALFAFLYRVVPNAFVPWRHALAGGLIAAAVFEIVRRGFAYYVARFSAYELIYGAFAAIPLFLIWLFCLWAIVLGGAVLTAGLSHWRGEAFRYAGDAENRGAFALALTVLSLLDEAQSRGATMSAKDFRQNINLGDDAIRDMLYRLESLDWVTQTGDAWLLKTDTDHIMLLDVFRRFVYRRNGEGDIQREVQALFMPLSGSLKISVAEFLRRCRVSASPSEGAGGASEDS